jgi:hypothetical protein
VAALIASSAPISAAPAITVGASDPGLEEAARRVDPGGALVVENLQLQGQPAFLALELERFEAWNPGAIVEVNGERRPAPNSRYFRGAVRGSLDSIALLMVSETGKVDGVVLVDGSHWLIGKQAGKTTLRSRRADLSSLDKPFECGSDHLGPPRELAPATLPVAPRSHTTEPFNATIAIETDYEYYALFSSEPDPVVAALDYLGLVIGYGDIVFAREIDTSMSIGYSRLWTGGASSDPWAATSGTDSALDEFVDYWNSNMQGVARTTAHFFSGKTLGGGIAYLGVLCSNYDAPGSSFDYGLSASLDGDFAWNGNPGANPAAVVWDIVVVLHEIGHNFNSPHTHDYCNIGGSTQPIDRCWTGCAGGAVGLPSCSSPPPSFNGGAGTIMSYCHLQPGGMGNISLTFGEGHTCGTLPYRAPDRMSSHVATRASQQPACLTTSAQPVLTVQKAGTGSGSVTSNPAGIDCGGTCSALFSLDTQVTLTATPASGSTFAGWSGSGCTGTGTCTVTMSQSRTVIATFDAPSACQPDAYEGDGASGTDDTCFGASISVGSLQNHTLCDEDWIYFSAAAGATYRIETSNLTGGADTTLAVHHDCGPELAFNDDYFGLASRIDWTPQEGTFVDVRVRSFADVYGDNRGYTFSVTCIANCTGGCPTELDLNSQTVSTTETFKALQTITAGNDFAVVSPGNVTFQAGGQIRLGDGFSVGAGASFTAIAGTPPTCPSIHPRRR